MERSSGKGYRTPLSHRLCTSMELPEEACRNCSKIEIVSNCSAVVDGCRSVLEYDESTVKLSLGKNTVTFGGTGLSISSLSSCQAMIEGMIISVVFGG